MNHYPLQWEMLQSSIAQQRIPQAMIFVGSLQQSIIEFTIKTIQSVFCNNEHSKPCLLCPECQMIARVEHPDIQWIKSEKSSGSIKVDQIRELHNRVYLTPQRAAYRVFIIESADKMNSSSANALLKIIEEPPAHSLFILIASSLSTILPTVLSRCHKFYLNPPQTGQMNHILSLAQAYPEDSEQAAIMKHSEAILNDLIALIKKEKNPSALAASYKEFELSIFLWFLYLVYAQLQQMYFNPGLIQGPLSAQLQELALLLNPTRVFHQINTMNQLLKKINQKMNVNHLLVLENLLSTLEG